MDLILVWKALSSYGVLGVVVVVEMFVIAKIYRDREAERTRHSLELDTFRDRYMTKGETYMEKYAELARSTHVVLDSINRASQERARARRITDADAR
jgi:hypothetical protein